MGIIEKQALLERLDQVLGQLKAQHLQHRAPYAHLETLRDEIAQSEGINAPTLLGVCKFTLSVMRANHDDIELSEQMAISKLESVIAQSGEISNAQVVVSVNGGCATVEEVPPGVTVAIRDYDIWEPSDDAQVDESGNHYIEEVYEG